MNYRKTVYWGTSSKIASTAAAAGVMAINTDTKRVHVFDGKTKVIRGLCCRNFRRLKNELRFWRPPQI